MYDTVWFVIIGYLCGSVLFARCLERLSGKSGYLESSPDGNPGTYNAFRYGGKACGIATLCGDVLKGFLPVYGYLHLVPDGREAGLAFVMAAPVIGHIVPVFYGFHGGKGIAVTFGCLAGLMPEYRPLLILAGVFLFFSVIVQISPNYHRTLITYMVSLILFFMEISSRQIRLGFLFITSAVVGKLLTSMEKKERCKVKGIWKH